ncbi:MAG TPA: endonuclease III [Candidatus Binatia bacterium]|nr:endonuclease III [Candidatus Binatia bacterium]
MSASRSLLKTRNRSCKKETFKQKSERAISIGAHLAKAYPELRVPLAHRNTFELLVAVMLSAQCTDTAVNRVTPELFRHYPDPETLALAPTAEIEQVIRTLGLFRAKARSLKECARQLIEDFGGEVPATMEELTRLAGVGRKTANVMLGHAFGKPGIIVDTHCKRLARRLDLTREDDPDKIERDLNRLLPPGEWTGFSHRLIIHGRAVCYARNPACARCVVNDLCPSRAAPANHIAARSREK